MTDMQTKPTVNSRLTLRHRNILLGLTMVAFSLIFFLLIVPSQLPPPTDTKNAGILVPAAIVSLMRIPFFMAGIMGVWFTVKSWRRKE